jgi:hypothetical protein
MRAGGSRNAQAALVARAHYAPVTPAWPGLIHASSMTVSRAGAEGLTARSGMRIVDSRRLACSKPSSACRSMRSTS